MTDKYKAKRLKKIQIMNKKRKLKLKKYINSVKAKQNENMY